MPERTIFAKWETEVLFAEQGRLYYSIVHSFASSGYRVSIFDNLDEEKVGRYGRLASQIPGVSFSKDLPISPKHCIYLYDQPDREIKNAGWRKQIHVKTDLFSRYWFKDPIIMPYGFYPKQIEVADKITLNALRESERKAKIFFAGDTENYHRVRTIYPKEKMPRSIVVDTVLKSSELASKLVSDEQELASFATGSYRDELVVLDHSNIKVPVENWLPSIAGADFFLSPPGIVMPMCHNIVEAMAVGSIPITNYPEWMIPNLRHRENCLVFEDKSDLIKQVKNALSMDRDEIERLRSNVIQYYEEHLSPAVFPKLVERRQEKRIVVLVYTERNSAKFRKKLGPHSILIKKGKVKIPN